MIKNAWRARFRAQKQFLMHQNVEKTDKNEATNSKKNSTAFPIFDPFDDPKNYF